MDIAKKLLDDGWSIKSEVVDPGDYKAASKHRVTVARNGREYATDYTMGCAYRVWIATRGDAEWRRVTFLAGGDSAWTPADRRRLGDPRKGETVPQVAGGVSLHHAKFLQYLTAPATPALDDVLYSLVADTSTVRRGQTFEEWCGDLGYDDDSRTAERSFNACRNTWAALVGMGADLDALDELFQDF